MAAGLMAAVALLTSCSDDDDGSAAPTVTTAIEATTSSSTSSSSTTAPPGSTATSRPSTTAAITPEAAARSLYEAWTRGDRTAAARVAQPAAVTTLFGRAWQAGDGWAFSECTGAAGSFICTWGRPGGQVLFRVQSMPVSVAEVRFQP